jgi:FtsZ-binding cell division protein ZapB
MENAFDQLEERVKKAAEVVRHLRHENKTLQAAVQTLEKGKGPSAEETHRLDTLGREVKELRGEREEIRRRIAKLIKVLDALDPEE